MDESKEVSESDWTDYGVWSEIVDSHYEQEEE
jgi:hypothetical protein